jgi:hypothetical protein
MSLTERVVFLPFLFIGVFMPGVFSNWVAVAALNLTRNTAPRSGSDRRASLDRCGYPNEERGWTRSLPPLSSVFRVTLPTMSKLNQHRLFPFFVPSNEQ